MAKISESRARRSTTQIKAEAHDLAARMPTLLVEARRVAHTVSQGIHGRRRAGPGETFWQFRHLEDSDAAELIDWRRSASSDHLYVREREWEAAHTVWLWPDLSPSMTFQSHLASVEKLERALVLSFAIGDLLVRSGERIGLLGVLPPTSSRFAMSRIAEVIVQQETQSEALKSLPPKAKLSAFSECILFSDFLEPIDELVPRLEDIAAQGVRGHLVQILDPAEETLPYTGRTKFESLEGGHTVMAGRAETLREKYHERLALHREELQLHLRRLEWSMLVHHTDHAASEPLLSLHTRLAGLDRDYRYRSTIEDVMELDSAEANSD